MIKGSSGALLGYVGDYVVKVGNERVDAQSDWLDKYPSDAVPQVFLRWPGGYVMERFDPIDWHNVDWPALVRTAIERLDAYVWCREATTEFDYDAHLAFMRERCVNLPGSWPKIQKWSQQIDFTASPESLIHGDPTFDNICMGDGQVVFVDPNPAGPHIPSCRAADLANIAQSVIGYEHVKYGRPMPRVSLDELLAPFPHAERRLVRYLTACKFVRLLAYETTHRPALAQVAQGLLQ